MQITDTLVTALDQLERAVRHQAEAQAAYTAALERLQVLERALQDATNTLTNTRQHVYRTLELRQ